MTSRQRVLYASAAALLLAGAGILAFGAALFGEPSLAPAAPRAVADARARLAPLALRAPPEDPRPAAGELVAPATHRAHEDEDDAEHAHAHPITPAHQRLRLERSFVARLDDAMDAGNGALLRETLAEYRRAFPEDAQHLQIGYGLIAACLEGGGEAARADAEQFYERRRGSSLRRWVRRHCLEDS